MAKYSISELLDLPISVINSIANSMTHVDTYKLYIAVIDLRLRDTVNQYDSELFKYRKKSIGFYQDRLKELK